MLNSIDESIDIISGDSKLLNYEDIEKHEINKAEDLFLLFLPNFSFVTPFHYLLSNQFFSVSNKLVDTINKGDLFKKFITNEDLINRIIEMFVYILNEKGRYPLSCIKEIYSDLSQDFDHEENEWETPEEKIIRENCLQVEFFLNEIVEKILKNKSFTERKEFNTY